MKHLELADPGAYGLLASHIEALVVAVVGLDDRAEFGGLLRILLAAEELAKRALDYARDGCAARRSPRIGRGSAERW